MVEYDLSIAAASIIHTVSADDGMWSWELMLQGSFLGELFVKMVEYDLSFAANRIIHTQLVKIVECDLENWYCKVHA